MATVATPLPVGARLGVLADRQSKYLMIGPAVLILLLIGIFPIVYTLVASFQHITMMEEDTSFSGLLNYARLFQDARLWAALGHTLIFTAIALPLELVLGMAMALLFLDRMPGRQVFIALLVLPTVISPIVAGAAWRLLFDNRFGPINQIIGWLAGEPVALLWLVNPDLVYPAIILCGVWQWTLFMFLILLAGLSNVDQSLIEAAEIDGAGWWRIFFKIVLPAIRPVLAIVLLIRALDLVRLFDIVWALTKGGPGTMTETISIYAYIQGFQQFETSYTAAIALLVIVILSILVIFALRRMEIADERALRGSTAVAPSRDPAPPAALPGRGGAAGLLPVPGLLAVHDLLQDAEEIFASPPVWYPESLQLANYAVLFRDGDAITVWNSLVVAGVSTVLAMVLGTIAAYSIARFRTGGDNLAIWIISERMIPRSRSCSRSSCSTSGWGGSTATTA